MRFSVVRREARGVLRILRLSAMLRKMPQEKSYTLRELRRRALLSGEQVAAKLRVHPNSVYGWERKRTVPNPAVVRRLARLYKVSREELLASLPTKPVG